MILTILFQSDTYSCNPVTMFSFILLTVLTTTVFLPLYLFFTTDILEPFTQCLTFAAFDGNTPHDVSSAGFFLDSI